METPKHTPFCDAVSIPVGKTGKRRELRPVPMPERCNCPGRVNVELAAALLELSHEPHVNASCHVGLCLMEDCAACQRHLRARAALRKAGVL